MEGLMSKEETLSAWLSRYMLKMDHLSHGTDVIPHLLYSAMDQFAKQQSIAFQQWCNKHADNNGDLFTPDLYEKFLSTL